MESGITSTSTQHPTPPPPLYFTVVRFRFSWLWFRPAGKTPKEEEDECDESLFLENPVTLTKA